jgi:hypothetical protein
VSYVLSSNYTGSYLNTKTKLQNYETPFKEKKEEGGEEKPKRQLV